MQPPDTHLYRLSTAWRFDAPQDMVWNAIADADGWPLWWPGIRSVTLERGDANGLGALRRYTCRGALPLDLRFIVRVTRMQAPHLIEGLACGDLAGIGRCLLRRNQGQTAVRFDWQVRTTGAWLNRLAPLLHPLLCWNHDRLMRAGGQGLARHLSRNAACCATGKPGAAG